MSGSPEKRRRHFDVDAVKARTGIVERFWNRVQKTDGCWNWIGHISKAGYGIVVLPDNSHIMAHRMSYALTNGNFDKKLDILHSCNNTACVRPDHLRCGTQQENMHDMIRRGRTGKYRNNTVLTEGQVRSIRKEFRLNDPDWGVKRLSEKYGVHPITVYDIITFRTWRDVL